MCVVFTGVCVYIICVSYSVAEYLAILSSISGIISLEYQKKQRLTYDS